MGRLLLAILLGVALALVIGWLLFARPTRSIDPRGTPRAAGATGAAAETRRIKATLFYVAEDGTRLMPVEREVPYAADPVAQALALVQELVKPVEAPYAQAIPEGTTVRALFITDRGDAYVDLSPEASTKHPGGSLDELFTVYAIVNTITVNLPAVQRVQILVDGKEVDTLAGHIDLRRPLAKNLSWAEAAGGTD